MSNDFKGSFLSLFFWLSLTFCPVSCSLKTLIALLFKLSICCCSELSCSSIFFWSNFRQSHLRGFEHDSFGPKSEARPPGPIFFLVTGQGCSTSLGTKQARCVVRKQYPRQSYQNKVGHSRKSKQMLVAPASQAVHMDDDVTTPHFQNRLWSPS